MEARSDSDVGLLASRPADPRRLLRRRPWNGLSMGGLSPCVEQPAQNWIIGTGLLERVGTGLLGTIGYVVLPTGVSTDVSRDIV